ncbi:retrotransposon protein, putative, ty1-copia subclass, partial [Tanacetum coccineum]
MASPKASISKPSKKPKFTIIPPKQLFIDLTNEDTITPSPKLHESSPSAPNAPSKTPSTKDTSSSSIDYTLFTKKKDSNLIIVQIYVDDIIFGSTCQEMCDDFAKIMHDEFEMSQLVAPEILQSYAWVNGSKEFDGLMLMTWSLRSNEIWKSSMLNDLAKGVKNSVCTASRESFFMRLAPRDTRPCCESEFLIGLRKEFDGFVQNYNMHSLGKTVNELHAMLKLHEQTLTLPKNNAPALHAIRAGKVQKAKIPLKPKRKDSAKDQSVMSVVETDTEEGTVSGLRASRKLKPRALSLYMGNGQREAEVENQLGNTIKSLRSDRGGEYMSQEFLDHLKKHGIIAHRTPPYTPQNNGVSERRNRTLLDIVRSMMSQTTLPKSFWDYALETAARILNMVPTKKVDKTPYEVWHGQAPKLSYLKLDPNLLKYSYNSRSLNREEDDQEIDEPQSDINPI